MLGQLSSCKHQGIPDPADKGPCHGPPHSRQLHPISTTVEVEASHHQPHCIKQETIELLAICGQQNANIPAIFAARIRM